MIFNTLFERLNEFKYEDENNEDLENSQYIIESSYNKKYKCPFCDDRFERKKLSSHIEKNHEDMISDEFTANRISFNSINKKTSGKCVQCGGETTWNENNIRYERFCSKKCKEEYVKIAKSRMEKKYGATHLLNDPEHQNKMLAGRKISGVYKSTKGEEFSYVGSYERKLLEFEDVVLGLTSMDIMTPGPVIKYTYEGKEHFWITDQYIIPFNLAIDVKDGGENPNTRNMVEYRKKQIAKEKALEKLGIYNYIRLTDNKFDQLLSIFLDIKYSMLDNPRETKPVIHVNENNTSINLDIIKEYNAANFAMPPNNRDIYIVPYLQNTVFTGEDINSDLSINYAVSYSNAGLPLLTYANNSYYSIPANKLKDYKMYKFNLDSRTIPNSNFEPDNLLECILGEKIYTDSKILYDDRFEEVESIISYLESFTDIIRESILNKEDIKIPIVEFNINSDDVKAYYETNGTGVYFESPSGLRSKIYDSIDSIDKNTLNLLKIL